MDALLALALLAATLPPLAHSPDVYVSGFFSASVQRFYGPRSAVRGARPAPSQSQAFYAPRGFARRPWGLAFGPDGNLYVANTQGGEGAILRVRGPFDPLAGMTEVFVSEGSFMDLTFGPDGNLYAGGRGTVRRYDIVTRALIDDFTRGYQLADIRGLAFGPDGNLYVSNDDSCVSGPAGCTGSKGEIVRFDGLTGQFLDVYVKSGEGGLTWPYKIAFGFDGELFIANSTPFGGNILRIPRGGWPFTGRTRRTTVFATYPDFNPLYVAVGPDHNLYVSQSGSGGDGPILRFDEASGMFIDVFIANVEGGPRGIAFSTGTR
jgi:DNA-binding beta-propeller fold protein YncE